MPTSCCLSSPIRTGWGFATRASGVFVPTSTWRGSRVGGSAGLLAANALFLATGVGVVALLGAGGGSSLFGRLGLAYIGGIAVVSILAAQLALLGVSLGLTGLAIVATVSVALGARRFARLRGSSGPRGLWGGRIVAGAALVQ